jgi:hypothetical protein
VHDVTVVVPFYPSDWAISTFKSPSSLGIEIMKFRLKAFGLHLLSSFIVLALLLGSLYLGWYRWPGWYLADCVQVTGALTSVDLVIGPLLTFIIASPKKPRADLMRDIGVIAVVQVCALAYGTYSLWNGRPLYYSFSEDVLQVVQAYDFEQADLVRAREAKLPLAPHWYNLPRWIWAPLPDDPNERDKIVGGVISGGSDVIAMPRYYRTWESGMPTLRTQLKPVDTIKYFSAGDKKILKERMQAAGIPADQANAMALLGRALPLAVIFDPATLQIRGVFKTR